MTEPLRYDDRVRVDVGKRKGQMGHVLEVNEWIVIVEFPDHRTAPFGKASLTKVESPAPVVG